MARWGGASIVLYYVATPYSSYPEGRDAAFLDACLATGGLVKRGFHVYSPIAHCHPIAMKCGLETDAATWAAFNDTMMQRADGLIVVMLPTWDRSIGVKAEIEFFRGAKKPIEYRGWPDLLLEGEEKFE